MRYKFRAWNKKRKRMYEVLHLHLDSFQGVWATVKGRDVINDQDIHIQIQPKDIEVMQWTGLTDRNGKDVYEGDILKIADDADEFITNGTVEWLHDFWNVSDIEDSLYGLTRNGYVEVIGNKFTHPELINS